MSSPLKSPASNPAEPLLEVIGLKKYYPIHGGFLSKIKGYVYAVDGVSFTVHRGETFGLVGESGCGKTTVGRTTLALMPATAGEVRFEGQNLFALRKPALRRMRRQMQIIYQDPYSSLDPRRLIGEIIAEPLAIHRVASPAEQREQVKELLSVVGLQASDVVRYPHELSGGQRQRVGIARALALRPKLVVCDEPVSALDVSIQSQILNLLDELQGAFGLTYIFIAHGLHVVKHVSDRVGVMYLGKLVEVAPADALFDHALHPYTRALLTAIPIPDPGRRGKRQLLTGDVPSPVNPPPGCRFHTRCSIVEERCRLEEPLQREMGSGHLVACHLAKN